LLRRASLVGLVLFLNGADALRSWARTEPILPTQRRDLADQDFGWWSGTLIGCRLTNTAASSAGEASSVSPEPSEHCDRLRLDQQIQGLMRISFLWSKPMKYGDSGKLVFVGLLEGDSKPMRCRQGRCQPQWPMRLRVSVVAQARFGPLGLATDLPATRLARGHCHVDYPKIHCRATSPDGHHWWAEARLRA
jgi:hypothetical protein